MKIAKVIYKHTVCLSNFYAGVLEGVSNWWGKPLEEPVAGRDKIIHLPICVLGEGRDILVEWNAAWRQNSLIFCDFESKSMFKIFSSSVSLWPADITVGICPPAPPFSATEDNKGGSNVAKIIMAQFGISVLFALSGPQFQRSGNRLCLWYISLMTKLNVHHQHNIW